MRMHDKCSEAPAGHTRDWLELLPAEPWLLVSISAPASKCAWAAARTPASQAMGEDCPELSLPLQILQRTQMANLLHAPIAVPSSLEIWRCPVSTFCRARHCNSLHSCLSQ